MHIDEQLILKLEHLSRLVLSPNERKQLKGDLENIIDMVDRLQQLDTSDVEPLVYLNEHIHLRDDKVSGELGSQKAVLNSPVKADDTYFVVPKVIDK